MLLRHATSDYDRRCVPPADPPLAEYTAKLHDYAACAKALPRHAAWHISPLARCQATAALLIQQRATPASQSTAEWLQEQRFGDWHGRPFAELAEWDFSDPATRPPQGESFYDVIARLKPYTSSLGQDLQKNPTTTSDIVLVTHAMVIRALLAIMLDVPPALVFRFDIQPLSLTALTLIDSTEGDQAEGGARVWRLDYLNRAY